MHPFKHRPCIIQRQKYLNNAASTWYMHCYENLAVLIPHENCNCFFFFSFRFRLRQYYTCDRCKQIWSYMILYYVENNTLHRKVIASLYSGSYCKLNNFLATKRNFMYLQWQCNKVKIVLFRKLRYPRHWKVQWPIQRLKLTSLSTLNFTHRPWP